MIEITNLTKSYGKNEIFKNLSFTFPNTGLSLIYGASGSGKSSLINMIAGFDLDFEGDISLGDQSVRNLKNYMRVHNVGFVFQDFKLIDGYTVFENIMIAAALNEDTQEINTKKIVELLQKFSLSDKQNEPIENLSGGQKQRVAIIRALINEPTIIIADEPTGSLDIENTQEIMTTLKRIAKDHLVIMITHDDSLKIYGDQVLAIEDKNLNIEKDNAQLASKKEPQHTVHRPKLSMRSLAMRNFFIHKSSLILISAILSIALICFSLSSGIEAMSQSTLQTFEKDNQHYQYGFIKGNDSTLFDALVNDERINLSYYQYVLDDVEIIHNDTRFTLEKKSPTSIAEEKISYGTMPDINKNDIALSPSLASKFNKSVQELIGQEIHLRVDDHSYTLNVSGIYNGSYDDYILSPHVEQELFKDKNPNDAYSMTFQTTSFDYLLTLQTELQSKSITVRGAFDEVSAFRTTFLNIQNIFKTVSLIVFIAGLVIASFLLNKQLATRRSEMGLLQAMGYAKSNAQIMLLMEAILVSLVTLFLTFIMSVFIYIIAHQLNFPLLMSMRSVIVTPLISSCITFVITIALSSRLTRIDIKTALRS